VVKADIMEKKKPSNKKVKVKPANKSMNWDKVGNTVDVIALDFKHLENGKTYKVTKEMAKVLVEKNAVKLK